MQMRILSIYINTYNAKEKNSFHIVRNFLHLLTIQKNDILKFVMNLIYVKNQEKEGLFFYI